MLFCFCKNILKEKVNREKKNVKKSQEVSKTRFITGIKVISTTLFTTITPGFLDFLQSCSPGLQIFPPGYQNSYQNNKIFPRLPDQLPDLLQVTRLVTGYQMQKISFQMPLQVTRSGNLVTKMAPEALRRSDLGFLKRN